MKFTLIVVVLGLGACALSTPVHETKQFKTVDHEFLEKQHKVLTLFKHVHQHGVLEEHVQIYQSVKDPVQYLQLHKDSFEKPEVVDTMIEFFHYNYFIPKNVPFSIMTDEHLEQAVALFKLYYYAKDFETFYKTAVVMHEFINEGLFVYATSVAVVHRKDTYGIILPPIYEIYPWYFFSTEVMQKAYKHKMVHGMTNKAEHDHHVYANYSGHYMNLHPEQHMSYFLEDVGINAFWYYYHIHYPHWMDGEEFHIKNDYRGEIFLATCMSLIARFHLERLSHGLGQIPHLDWDVPFDIPYYPSLQYPNGLSFPERPNFANFEDHVYNYGIHMTSHQDYGKSIIKHLESRLSEAVDVGMILNMHHKPTELYHHDKHEESVNQFGNLLQGNPDSPNPKAIKNYTIVTSHTVGYSSVPFTFKEVVPSALEHFETALRDPGFYPMMQKMMHFYYEFQQNHMKPYTKQELVFPGVTIEKVEMDRLITYFDHFYADISNGVFDTEEELKQDTFKVWAVQNRINHKPFTYKIHVNSNQDTNAMVKVFLGPKYNEYGRYINISENRLSFVPIDAFQWHLKSGPNIIKRSSQESEYCSHDKTTFEDLHKKVLAAYKGQGEFHVTGKENYFYFPDRLMLPMGSYNGVPYQFYFIVYPFKQYMEQKEEMTYFYPRPGTGGGFIDDHPIMYPFDKPIKYGKMFVTEIPNSYFYETKIYHRTIEEAQMTQTQHQH